MKGLDLMPAQRLGTQPVSIHKYDVAAQDSATTPHFIRHVGLADEQRDNVRSNSEISLVHMGPPLTRGHSANPVHAIGKAGLTAGQIRQIDVFVDEHVSEYEAEPHGLPSQCGYARSALPANGPVEGVAEDDVAVVQPKALDGLVVGILQLDVDTPRRGRGEVEGEAAALEDERLGDELAADEGCVDRHEAVDPQRVAAEPVAPPLVRGLADVD